MTKQRAEPILEPEKCPFCGANRHSLNQASGRVDILEGRIRSLQATMLRAAGQINENDTATMLRLAASDETEDW